MSDTPETDAFFFRTDIDWGMEVDFARRLERERDEALEESAKWKRMAIEADKRFVESVLVRDEESKKSRREHELANEAIATWQKTRDERDEAREQLDAAIVRVKDLVHENENLYRRLESVHERDLEELIAAAKAVIDRWETPFWKEAAHTGSYIAALRKAVEIAEGGHL